MKRIVLALGIFASVVSASAQTSVKSTVAAQKALEKAIEKSENPKQAEKPATWVKLGKAYVDAYEAPKGNGWIGALRAELALILGEDKPSVEEYVELWGTQYIKATFETRNYYYSTPNELLQFIEVTKPIVDSPLEKALDAYITAHELDVNGKSTKDLTAAFQTLTYKFTDEAYVAYNLNDMEKASYYFQMAVKASEQEPYAKVDTNAVYNAALTSYMLKKYEIAKKYYKRSIELGYYGEDGDAFAKIADIEIKEENVQAAKAYLEEAFLKFPKSQSVLVGLINFYMNSGEDTARLFELINAAKENEPNNASLYYVEGNINLQLGREQEAIAAYSKCSEISPEYEFGYIGIGQLYYNKAVALQDEAANEMDQRAYEKLYAEFEAALKSCIEPFEHAYVITKDPNIKLGIAEYLKNACYRFQDPIYQAKYDEYKAVVDAAK